MLTALELVVLIVKSLNEIMPLVMGVMGEPRKSIPGVFIVTLTIVLPNNSIAPPAYTETALWEEMLLLMVKPVPLYREVVPAT
jgi:hypothetical protein